MSLWPLERDYPAELVDCVHTVHAHFIVEVDSKQALAAGMKKLLHSISRRLNALSVAEHGGVLPGRGVKYSALLGWIGRVFTDRYHAHVLETPTEIARAVKYVAENLAHHGGPANNHESYDPFESRGAEKETSLRLTTAANGYLLRRELRIT